MTTDNRGALSDCTVEPRTARERILLAFSAMVLVREARPKRVADLAARAGVARSTFYDHFRSADDLELEAVAVPLRGLADLAAGLGSPATVEPLLAHFWEYRSDVRRLLAGPRRPKLERLFERLVAERLAVGPDNPLVAAQSAAALLAAIDAWVHSRYVATSKEIAARISATADAIRCAL